MRYDYILYLLFTNLLCSHIVLLSLLLCVITTSAFGYPRWTVIVHAVVWFFGMSAMWIAAAAIQGNCTAMGSTAPQFPRAPPGVYPWDIRPLQARPEPS